MSAKSEYPLQWQAIALPSEAVTGASPIGRCSDARRGREWDRIGPYGPGEGHQRGVR